MSTISNTSANLYIINNGSSYTTSTTYVGLSTTSTSAGWDISHNLISNYLNDKIVIPIGTEVVVKLPGDVTLTVNKDGSYKIEDSDKVTYKRCNIREFNRYINASDLLEEFIKFMGKFDIKQGEILSVPIELFINFLIIRSCQEDNDDLPPDVKKIEDHSYLKRKLPRCGCCGRFIPNRFINKNMYFCSGICFDKSLNRG